VVAAPYYDFVGIDTNLGLVVAYHGSSAGLSTTASFYQSGYQMNELFGTSIACAGDVNGDGYSDVIIGAPKYDSGAAMDIGCAYVFLGSASGLQINPNIILYDFSQPFCESSSSVASAGDVNGDGYSDVIIGAYKYDDAANTDEGRAYVYHGSAAGLSTTPNSIPDDANQANANFGYSVSSAGDINADAYSDVIIGAPNFDDGANVNEGRAFVYHGSATGLPATPNNTPDDADQAGALFGYSVSGAGDINGDGYSDVIIGAADYDDGANTNEGRAFVYHGSAAGLPATPTNTPDDANQVNAGFGNSVAFAGDVNGDGYSDVIIGASSFDDGANADEGRAYIYHGSATGLPASPNSIRDDANQAGATFALSVAGAGDVNGDGYSDVIVGAPYYNDGANADEGRAFIYYGSVTGIAAAPNSTPDDADKANVFFGYSVAGAGDVNGDGYGDVIIGCPKYEVGAADNEGRVWVYHGSATGIPATPTYVRSVPNPEMLVDADMFGNSVASAGDVNGDGYSDIIAGGYKHTKTAGINVFEGASYIFYGSPSGLPVFPNSKQADANQANAAFGTSVAGAGDINGDGYSDVISGADLYDDGANTNEGRAFLYNGNEFATNKRNNLRLYNTDLTTPINSSNFIIGNFGAGLFAKSFLGRNSGKLVWETRLNFNAYSGNPITNSVSFTSQQATYTNLGLAGAELKNVINKINGGGKYTKLRARVKYNPALAITGQVYGPWRYVSSIIDGNNLGTLPIELLSFTAAWKVKGKTAQLSFTTDKESGICCFDIEKSTDGFNYNTIGTIPAKNISGIQSYSFIDANATGKNQYYRLKIKGISGKTELSNIQQLQNDKASEILVFPNPTTDVLQLQLNKVYGKMNVQIVNSSGQMVKQLTVAVSNQTITIPVQNLAAGKYWLHLQSGDEKQVLQFVKQ
jgi:hypothetical protein